MVRSCGGYVFCLLEVLRMTRLLHLLVSCCMKYHRISDQNITESTVHVLYTVRHAGNGSGFDSIWLKKRHLTNSMA